MPYRYKGNDYTLPDAVKKAVSVAGQNDDRNGQLELMQAQIDKLAEMVGTLAAAMTENRTHLTDREIEDDILGYDWEEV
jgi:PDZ domain-containing secreted protein